MDIGIGTPLLRRKGGGFYRCVVCEGRTSRCVYHSLSRPVYDHLDEMDDGGRHPYHLEAEDPVTRLTPQRRSHQLARVLTGISSNVAATTWGSAATAILVALAEAGVGAGQSRGNVVISATPEDYAWMYPALTPLLGQPSATDPDQLPECEEPAGTWQDMEVRTGMLVDVTRIAYDDPDDSSFRSVLVLKLPVGGSTTRSIPWQNHRWAAGN